MKGGLLFLVLPAGAVSGFASVLLDAGIKSGVLLLIAAIATASLGNASAATRWPC